MKRSLLAMLATLTFGIGLAAAQAPQPYAGMQARQIKALSDQQIADLKSGRGMGLALAAELNGYPGPLHLLELADQLALTEPQRASIRQMFEAMKAEAVPLGEKLIAQEGELDRLFAGRTITADSLRSVTADIGATQAALRNTHLKYHLSTVAILTPAQVARYGELRGYVGGGHRPQHGPHR
jgi:Spy/CpxP family protein refolding chaperone